MCVGALVDLRIASFSILSPPRYIAVALMLLYEHFPLVHFVKSIFFSLKN